MWPWPVDEVVFDSGNARTGQRAFVSAGSAEPAGRQVARDRPITLVAVEVPGQGRIFGYVVGVRPEPGAALQAPPPDLRLAWVERPSLAGAVLVLIEADERLVELPLAEVARLYRPNQMSLAKRSAMVWQRLGPGWRERRSTQIQEPESAVTQQAGSG